MNSKKKIDKPDMTYINAAALQDHYLRTVNINIKPPPSFMNSNRIIQKLKMQEQKSAMLQTSAQQILSWGKQNEQTSIQAIIKPKTDTSGVSSTHLTSENQSNSRRQHVLQEVSTSTGTNIGERRGSSRSGLQQSSYIRISHHKVQINHPSRVVKVDKKQFLPPLPHEIDAIRVKKETENDQKKMAKFMNNLTLAQRLGIVPAPPKPLTRDDWVSIEEQSKKRDEGQCPICLEDFKESSQIILSCSHVFHKQCLESFEKHNKVNTCPICRRQHYDKKQWDEGYKKYIVKCAILIQKRWRGGRVRFVFFTDLLSRKYKALSARMRRKILGYKLGKFNAKITTAMEKNRQNANKAIQKYDDNIKLKIQEMYAQMYRIQSLKEKNQQDINQFLGNETQLSLQNSPDYEIVNDAHLNGAQRLKQDVILEADWMQIKNKAISRCDKDCAICYNNLYTNEHVEDQCHANDAQQTCTKPKKGLYILSCTHIFHASCISAFERYNLPENQVCPICRSHYQKQHFMIQQQ